LDWLQVNLELLELNALISLLVHLYDMLLYVAHMQLSSLYQGPTALTIKKL